MSFILWALNRDLAGCTPNIPINNCPQDRRTAPLPVKCIEPYGEEAVTMYSRFLKTEPGVDREASCVFIVEVIDPNFQMPPSDHDGAPGEEEGLGGTGSTLEATNRKFVMASPQTPSIGLHRPQRVYPEPTLSPIDEEELHTTRDLRSGSKPPPTIL